MEAQAMTVTLPDEVERKPRRGYWVLTEGNNILDTPSPRGRL